MHLLHDKDHLFSLMAQGACVITPNNRLSASLLEHYYDYCPNQTVDKPYCAPLRASLIQAFERVKIADLNATHPILLTDAQCRHLWEQLIKKDAHKITYSEGLLDAVMRAWDYCLQWQISADDTQFHYHDQSKQFQLWWQTFNRHLIQLNAITEHQIVPYLIEHNKHLFSTEVIWVCFDEFNPIQRALQDHLQLQGLTQYQYDLQQGTDSPLLFAANDETEEYQQLISWLKLRLQRDEQRIGVVIPDLQQKSRTLQRRMIKEFPQDQFNISLGQSLSSFSIVDHALTWLSLDSQSLTPHELSLLLQSPYLGHAKAEFNLRSQYLQDSFLIQEQKIQLKKLQMDLHNRAPQLAELLNQLKPYPKTSSAHDWVQLMQDRLNTLGFPGDYGLNSENYQCFNRFTGLFDELRELGLVQPQMNASQALNAIKTLAKNTIFQAQNIKAQIHITGLLEASGCEFDSLWVMGLTDHCLPQKTRLSAFIPHQMQIKLQMPHSIAQRELHLAQVTLQRLQNGSPATVFSYAKMQADTPNLPCALITHFSPYLPIEQNTAEEQNIHSVPHTESYLFPLGDEEQFSGGTALLANQAKCPFKAFAEHRLTAKPSLEVIDGLDQRERGQIIHKVLEILWQSIGSQAELIQLNESQLEQRIESALHQALMPLCDKHPDSFSELVQEIEFSRLNNVVRACLEWEKQRPAFTVDSLEQSYTVNLAELDFKVRVDRIDKVGEHKWVIDYKSNLPASKPWYEERPKEPQLLLYALLDEQINALLLLQVKAGKISCSGLSEEKQNISGLSALKKDDHWQQQRQNWKQQLEHLAEEFKQGHCPPQPASAAICQLCDFQNLCRFQAQADTA